ncbi:MAG TPA: hypothetical protein DIW31_09110, partial [Bacteroidales bacterium]|nr:hypothetical protein [Bacteroidales bacterium]
MPKFIIISLLILFNLNLSAQNDSIRSFLRDSLGKVIIKSGTKTNLYIGLSADGSNSIMLKSDVGSEALQWNGHGFKRLTRFNAHLGRWVSLDIFADAMPPKTKLDYDSNKGVLMDSVFYISGQGIIELNSIDPDAGLLGIYYTLNDGAIIKYSDPIMLKSEGEYKLSVYSVDNVGNKEKPIKKTLFVDNTPPLSHLDLVGDKFDNIISGRSSLSITSIDALGVKQTFYAIDSGTVTLYSGPIKASTIDEGEHTIKWYSVDEVDNVEETKAFTFYVDKTPPMVFEEIVGNTYIVAGKEFSSGRSQLRIAAVDNKSGIKEIKYSLNKEPFTIYERPVYLSDILGVASIKSFAIDNVGNQSISDTHTESFTIPVVDITGPQISYFFTGPKTTIRDTLWIGPKTKISIHANDNGAGVSKINYQVKGTEERLYSEPFTVETAGKHEIVCNAFDNVDNVNLLSFKFNVDNQAPKILYHFSNEPHSHITENDKRIPVFLKGLKIYLAATDDISGVEKLSYTLNGLSENHYTAPIEWLKPNTTYTLVIKSADILG